MRRWRVKHETAWFGHRGRVVALLFDAAGEGAGLTFGGGAGKPTGCANNAVAAARLETANAAAISLFVMAASSSLLVSGNDAEK